MRFLRCASLVVVLAIAGCDVPVTTPPPAAAPAPPPPPAPTPPSSGGVESAPATSTGVTSPPAPAAGPATLNVELETAVALAQTGPDGTLVGFSVDYKFATAPPQVARFGLLLARLDGQTMLAEQTLQTEGNIAVLVPSWKPEHGPFTASIVQLDNANQTIAESDAIGFQGP